MLTTDRQSHLRTCAQSPNLNLVDPTLIRFRVSESSLDEEEMEEDEEPDYNKEVPHLPKAQHSVSNRSRYLTK